MTDIEQKALALLNDVRTERGFAPVGEVYGSVLLGEALCRAIESHEAFRQQVSDAVVHCHACSDPEVWRRIKFELDRFIITAAKPDPLVEIIGEIDDGTWGETKAEYAAKLRAALEARGLDIREKGQ